jgi:hypothetical protein
MIKKVIKAAKIFGYSTELLLTSYIYFQFNKNATHPIHPNDIYPALPDIKESIDAGEYSNATLRSIAQTPFLASIGHAFYGLYSEVKPLAKQLIEKIQNKVTKKA